MARQKCTITFAQAAKRHPAGPRTQSCNSRLPDADAGALEPLRFAYTSGTASHGIGGRGPVE
jgi:hypothetical protein